MVLYWIDMDFVGANFSPAKFLETLVSSDFKIVHQNEVGDLMIHPRNGGYNKKYGFGNLSIRNKHQLEGIFKKRDTLKEPPYEEWYVDFLEQHCKKLIECGVEEIILLTTVSFLADEQCNLEYFDGKQLARLMKLPFKLNFPISIYNDTPAGQKEALKNSGYTDENTKLLNE